MQVNERTNERTNERGNERTLREREQTSHKGILTRNDSDDGDAKPGGKCVEYAATEVPHRFSFPFPNDAMPHSISDVVSLPIDRVEIIVFGWATTKGKWRDIRDGIMPD